MYSDRQNICRTFPALPAGKVLSIRWLSVPSIVPKMVFGLREWSWVIRWTPPRLEVSRIAGRFCGLQSFGSNERILRVTSVLMQREPQRSKS